MQRYMVSDSLLDFPNEMLRLEGEPFHHMKNVMRFRPGTTVFLTDPNGLSCLAEITELTNQYAVLKWVADEERSSELPVRVTIASGLPKGDKMDFIIQKITELGADQLVPFQAKHSVVKWDENKKKKKQQRFRKIALEAAEQSHRQQVPDITEIMDLSQLIQYAENFPYKLVAYEEEAKAGELGNFAAVLRQMRPDDRLLMIFGPEGGLDPEEISYLKNNGFSCCGLGPRIMRAETAPLYALAAVSYHFELLNGGDSH